MTLIRDAAYWARINEAARTAPEPPEEATSLARRFLGPGIFRRGLTAAKTATRDRDAV
jgi:hypothetical protein